MEILFAALGGFCLDLLLGDPAWMPHPVVLMGRCITKMEDFLRKRCANALLGGAILAFILPFGTLALSSLALWLCALVHPALRFALEMLWCWQCLAIKGLASEAKNVHRALTCATLDEARHAVGRIVGRDTQCLSAEGVARAAVETVAENFSDGVTAPLLYMFLGGAPLALFYKAINTMDSMIGYKNDRYLYFGRTAAKLDDFANYLPARLSALALIAAVALTGHSARRAWKIWRRDRRNHASPNSAQTEAAMAGALGIQLGGSAFYFGKLYFKPTIGDPLREVDPEDIFRAIRMLYAGSFLCLALFALIRGIFI